MDTGSIDKVNGNGLFSSASVSSENSDSTRHNLLFGSSVPRTLKQGRNAGVVTEEQDWRCPKMGTIERKRLEMATEKGNHSLFSSSSFLRTTSNTTHSLFPDGQQMLSFSSPKPDSLVPPYYNHLLLPPSCCCVSTPVASTFARNTGPNMNVHGGVLAGVRGAFTPSQWVELEHQVMIYKYIDANAPIPPTLLISIKKTQNQFGSLTPPTAYGWGSCQLGFSGNSDPEPGRCRRTDGKKWRCSRDAVADQKYCERHMNRGRHRSRKPVEGHTGQAKTMPIIAPSPSASSIQPPSHHTRILLNKDDSVAKDDGKVAEASIPKQYNPFEQQQSTNRADLVLSAAYNYDYNSYIDEGWPEENQSDRTELSITIPTTCCSEKNSNLSLSPPLKKLKTQETNPIGMNHDKQGTWAPVSWGASMGGPLGEVLNNSVTANINSFGLNMIDCWDSSPTGVLQKNSFGSHSSSAGSSPRASAAAADTITTTAVAAHRRDDLSTWV